MVLCEYLHHNYCYPQLSIYVLCLLVLPSISLRFLSHLMSDSDTCHLLVSGDVSSVGMLFRSWLSAIVSCGGSSALDPHARDALMEFTR